MRRWVALTTSNIGKREHNEDFVNLRLIQTNSGRCFYAMLACDGVGGNPDGEKCSLTVGKATLDAVEVYMRNRLSKRPLNSNDVWRLSRKLQSLRVHGVTRTSATTMVLALFEQRKQNYGQTLLVFWAGDSRIHLLPKFGVLSCLTTDHHDLEGRLTSYIDGKGHFHGKLEAKSLKMTSRPIAICATTDGVHEHCRHEELVDFLDYCIKNAVDSDTKLSTYLSSFLSSNVSDNFSLALLYQQDK